MADAPHKFPAVDPAEFRAALMAGDTAKIDKLMLQSPPNDALRATEAVEGGGSTSDLAAEYLAAVVAGDKTKVIQLLDQGVPPRFEDDLALCVAAEEGHDDLVDMLLDRGCDPAAQDFYPLRLALMRGHGAIADRLAAAVRARTSDAATKQQMEVLLEDVADRPIHHAQTPREAQVYRPEAGVQLTTVAMATRDWPVPAKKSLVNNLRFGAMPLTSRLINFALRLASDLTGKSIAPRIATKLNIKSVEMPEAMRNNQAQGRTALDYPVEQTEMQVGSVLSRDVPGNAPTKGVDFVEAARASVAGRPLHSGPIPGLSIDIPDGTLPGFKTIDPDRLMARAGEKVAVHSPSPADASLDIPAVPRAASTVTPRRPRPE